MSQLHFEKIVHADCVHFKDGPLAVPFCWGERLVCPRCAAPRRAAAVAPCTCHARACPCPHAPSPCVRGRCGGFNHNFGCGEAHAIGNCPYTKEVAQRMKKNRLQATKKVFERGGAGGGGGWASGWARGWASGWANSWARGRARDWTSGWVGSGAATSLCLLLSPVVQRQQSIRRKLIATAGDVEKLQQQQGLAQHFGTHGRYKGLLRRSRGPHRSQNCD